MRILWESREKYQELELGSLSVGREVRKENSIFFLKNFLVMKYFKHRKLHITDAHGTTTQL